jgi:hypothetical protein
VSAGLKAAVAPRGKPPAPQVAMYSRKMSG